MGTSTLHSGLAKSARCANDDQIICWLQYLNTANSVCV